VKPAGHAIRTSEIELKDLERARDAIVFDLANEAVPLFVNIARSSDERNQFIAAQMLFALAKYTRIEASILNDLVLPVFVRALMRGKTELGHSMISLNSYIEVPSDVLELAQKAAGKLPTILPQVLE
jgi:hypothetical protein